jgi:hypothetical protein
VNQRTALGESGLIDHPGSSQSRPHTAGQIAGRIGVWGKTINRWAPRALPYALGPEFRQDPDQLSARPRSKRSPLRPANQAPVIR